MLRYVKRADINTTLYDACVARAAQQFCYGFSWYLDAVCSWDALVMDDYVAVMPVPNRKKWGVSYVHPPLWVLQLGVFSHDMTMSTDLFVEELKKRYRFIEQRLNSFSTLTIKDYFQNKEYQELNITKTVEDILKGFRNDRIKDLKRAQESYFKGVWDAKLSESISLFRNTIGQRLPDIKQADYNRLENVFAECIKREVGRVLSIYDDQKLIGSACVLCYKDTVTILCSSTAFDYKNKGVNTFLMYKLIEEYHQKYATLNFGGSSISTIANFFKSFGAQTQIYPFVKINNLPFPLSLCKH